MEVFTYQVKAEELDERFIQALKSLFKGKEISISVQQTNVKAPKNVAAVSQPTLSEMIAEREKDPVRYAVPGEVFSALADRLLENETFDIAHEIKKYKVEST